MSCLNYGESILKSCECAVSPCSVRLMWFVACRYVYHIFSTGSRKTTDQKSCKARVVCRSESCAVIANSACSLHGMPHFQKLVHCLTRIWTSLFWAMQANLGHACFLCGTVVSPGGWCFLLFIIPTIASNFAKQIHILLDALPNGGRSGGIKGLGSRLEQSPL